LEQVLSDIAEARASLRKAEAENDRESVLKSKDILILLLKKEERLTSGSADSDEADYDYKKFPFYFDALKRVGLQTPYEQYTLYISFGVFLYGAYTPFRKAVFLNKWLHETDPSLKDIWAARANLSLAEQNGGERYLQELKRVPKRYAVLPLSFLLIEGIRSGYRKLSHVFTHKQ